MYDLVIKSGLIVDGAGDQPFIADVAVDKGAIEAIEAGIQTKARRTIDAEGAIVTPGFVDIHTHYDGQITWDDMLDPSASHGTTTIVTGNCGVGFAPVRPDHHHELIELMEGVEDIPGTALYEGIDWAWESFPEYLDLLENKSWTMDVGTQIAHGAMRAYVMGERGIRNESATAEDIEAMARITADAMSAGALGFSTSRILGHQSISGEPVPGTFAAEEEVFAIGRAMGFAGTVFQLVPGGLGGREAPESGPSEPDLEQELIWMERLSKETGLPITFLVLESMDNPDLWKKAMKFVHEANKRGARLYPQTASRPAGVLLSWQSNHLFIRRPTYIKLADLPLKERLEALRNSEVRNAILSEENAPPLSESVNDEMHLLVARNIENVFELGFPMNYEPSTEDSIAAEARRSGIDVEAHMYDAMMAEDGRAILMMPSTNFARGNCEALFSMMTDENSVLGLADGGAHCGLICDASSTTHLLTHWVRDRQGERIPLEYLIKKQCADTAALYGLSDRGVLAQSMRADINVIDFENLELGLPYATNDLPAGGQRFLQKASGYIATITNGVVVRENDEDTGARPGRLIRGRR
ncbi:MAG: amidohydrolase family protein [Chloroflexota bacterium]|nr:amidohydrolase family protein [Chloroflexota bacterium]